MEEEARDILRRVMAGICTAPRPRGRDTRRVAPADRVDLDLPAQGADAEPQSLTMGGDDHLRHRHPLRAIAARPGHAGRNLAVRWAVHRRISRRLAKRNYATASAILLAGKRRTALARAIEGILEDFRGRILPFDRPAASALLSSLPSAAPLVDRSASSDARSRRSPGRMARALPRETPATLRAVG
jgi:hypothetical protein